MEELRTQAFVLRSRPYGESDRIVVLLTYEHGKLSGIAKGARRSRRRFAGPALEPFQQLEIRFSQRPRAGLVFLHECKVLHSYHAIAERLDAYAWASFLCELTEAATPEHDPCPQLYDLFRATIERLATHLRPEPDAHHFILGLLEGSGWGPDFSHCGLCRQPLSAASRPLLDLRGSGLICARHEADQHGLEPQDRGFKPGRRVIGADLLGYIRQAKTRIPKEASPKTLNDATALLARLVELVLQRPLRSREFLNQVLANTGP